MINKNKYNEGPWYLYIAKCRDGELYIGIAKNVERRIEEHNKTSKCRYTRYRKPVMLLHNELCGDYTMARKREREIKRFSRQKKLALIK